MIEAIFILYLLLIICVGILSNKFVSSQLDFFISWKKAWTMGNSFFRKSFRRVSMASSWAPWRSNRHWIWRNLGSNWYYNWYYILLVLIAERLRDETEKFDSLTIPDFLEKKFNDSSGLIRIISALIIGIFLLLCFSAVSWFRKNFKHYFWY